MGKDHSVDLKDLGQKMMIIKVMGNRLDLEEEVPEV
jgi:hypothetical protein